MLDNFSGRGVDLELENIRILFLPPKTTSVTQPLDRGIINDVKQLYKKMLVEHYWSESKQGDYVEINLLQGIRFLKKAWDEVKERTISAS